jgi:DNA end-binding protein Ku
LEGLPQALARLRINRHLSRDFIIRKSSLQHAEPGHRQSAEAQDGGCGHRRRSSHRGSDQGYAVGKDQYVQVEDDELANIAIESTHTVDIEKFVPKASIDDRFRDTAYYLAPEDRVGQEAFAVIRDAMKKKKMVGIARVVMASREKVMMLEPFGKGIMGTTLHYPYEIRGDEAVFEEIPDLKLPDQMVGLAEDIIDKMSGEFEPDKFEDRYEQAMIELIRSKQAGLPAPKEKPAARPANVVNLMDALRRSIDAGSGKPKAAKSPAKRAASEAAAPAKKRKKAG